ncbi:MAG TPA: sugar phosphate isomerase/epimerase family protein [Candidatus Hypogeohydataceae bacterium YC38]
MGTGQGAERVKEAGLINLGLGRYEVFDHPADGLLPLKRFLAEKNLPFGIHTPLCRPSYFPYTPVTSFLLSEDPEKRRLSLDLIEDTTRHARDWGAEYIVCHFTWREDTQDRQKALRLASQSAQRLSELSQAYSLPINIEYAGYSNAFYEPREFIEVLSPYPNLGICMDTGHAFICSRLRGRNYLRDIEVLAPYARSMHLWNTKSLEHWKVNKHVPLHPSQRPEEGWIDIKRTLEVVLGHNKEIKIIFEYSVDGMSDEIKEGFQWVRGIVDRFKSKITD